MRLKFGVSPSPHPWWIGKVKEFEKWIMEAENCGYDAIFLPDHYNLPVPMFPSNELIDTWSTLAFIAAKTTHIKIGTCVTPLPRYLPSQLAKIIATVDILSNGRIIAGLGAGTFQEEFINYSPQGCLDEPRKRVDRFLEGLQVMIKLWTMDKVTFNGRFYKLKEAVLLPKPVQKPYPPLWAGAVGSRMLRISAKYFNAWVPSRGSTFTPTPEKYEAGVKIITDYLKRYGRNTNEFTFALLGWMTEKVVDDIDIIDKFVKAGCQYYIVEIPLTPPVKDGRYIQLIRKFAREVMPSF
ncbi:MAG: LLM class flavin-dependent oxidoreductase [Candidatus Bathyarchaeia archaeon]|nr:LLM class flavin-dependent oxidoreductase [Candidatus Bathyarchaeota archaeon]